MLSFANLVLLLFRPLHELWVCPEMLCSAICVQNLVLCASWDFYLSFLSSFICVWRPHLALSGIKIYSHYLHFLIIIIVWKSSNSFTPFRLDLDVNTPATLHWHALQILGWQPWITLRCQAWCIPRPFDLVDHDILLKKLDHHLSQKLVFSFRQPWITLRCLAWHS